MARKKIKPGKRYRLEVYFRIGQRMRLGPLLIALLGLALLGLFFLMNHSIIQVPIPIRAERRYAIALIFVGAVLYVVNIIISRISIVQPRADHLFIRAGIMPLVISYERIRSLRPVRVGDQYPRKSLKGADYDLMEPLLGMTAVSVDMPSFPIDEWILRRLWSKFLFSADKKGLLLAVKDYMGLAQEIDVYRQRYLDRKAGREGGSGDFFDRVASRQEGRR